MEKVCCSTVHSEGASIALKHVLMLPFLRSEKDQDSCEVKTASRYAVEVRKQPRVCVLGVYHIVFSPLLSEEEGSDRRSIERLRKVNVTNIASPEEQGS